MILFNKLFENQAQVACKIRHLRQLPFHALVSQHVKKEIPGIVRVVFAEMNQPIGQIDDFNTQLFCLRPGQVVVQTDRNKNCLRQMP